MAGFGVDRSSAASGSGASASSIPESIIDAKGDLIAGASADTPARVAVGANEQRLVADSTQGGGLAWKSDTTNYAVTAKGELLIGTAADTVAPLTIGAAGEILLPASGASTGAAWLRFPPAGAYLINGKIARSVGASALTLAVKTLADADPSTSSPVYVLMPTATSNVLDGGYTIRSITGALSMTVSSGSTLGHTSAVASPVVVYLIDNAGTLELAASAKFFGGASVQTTTAEGGAGAADTATTIYSTTLRSNVVTVCLLRWKSTQAAAGTWAATTGEVQLFPFPYKDPTATTYTSGSGNFAPAWDCLYFDVELWGGGASGGGGNGAQRGTGGGGGGYVKKRYTTPVGNYAYSVGAAGAAAAQGANGNAGGDTTFGGTLTASGGAAGAVATGGAVSGVPGGAAAGGDENLAGGGSDTQNTGTANSAGGDSPRGGFGGKENVTTGGLVPGGGGSCANNTGNSAAGARGEIRIREYFQ